MIKNTEPIGSNSSHDAGSSAAVLVINLCYAIGAPLLVAASGYNISMDSKESRSLVVLSLGLPILFCGWATFTIARRLGKGIAFGTIAGAGLGQLVGFHLGLSYVAPIIGTVIGAAVGTLFGLLAVGAADKS